MFAMDDSSASGPGAVELVQAEDMAMMSQRCVRPSNLDNRSAPTVDRSSSRSRKETRARRTGWAWSVDQGGGAGGGEVVDLDELD